MLSIGSKVKIVCLDGYTLNPGDNPWDEVAKLGELRVYDRTSEEKIIERAFDADIILTNKTPLKANVLKELPNLKFISVLATGYNIVDVKFAREKGVIVSNVPAYSTDSVAEFVFALIFHLVKAVSLHSELVFKGEWTKCEDFSFLRNSHYIELAGKTIGIVGFGAIGSRVAELAHAFKMNVLAYSRTRKTDVSCPVHWKTLEELFSESDFVTLHCPLDDHTRGMVGKDLLRRMKRTAYLINTARGPIVDEKALAEALNEGLIAGAACDVVSKEPIKADNPLLKAKNIVITPHIAWATIEARKRLMRITAENIASFLSGKPKNVVN